MRIVHLADPHLGFRQFQRQTPTGLNQREADVAQTFARTIDAVIKLQPDVVLIAGDVFHVVRPTNPAILHAFIQLSKLITELPRVRVVIAAGNHDLPKTTEAGCILSLFARLDRIDVATFEPVRFDYPDLELSVLAVPYSLDRRPRKPNPEARYNVLLIHGQTPDVIPRWVNDSDRANVAITEAEFRAEEWDYAAFGHYHVHHRIAPNAYYAGSTDYTSPNPWFELYEERDLRIPGKGFIERDLVTGKQTFHPVPVARALIDFPPIEGRGMSASELDDAIRRAVDSVDGGIEDRIVRLIVRDVPRHIIRELDHRALREYRKRALNFQLDPRRPEPIRITSTGAPGRRPTLADVVRDKLRARTLPSDVDRDALITLGLDYLTEAEQLETAPSLGSEAPL